MVQVASLVAAVLLCTCGVRWAGRRPKLGARHVAAEALPVRAAMPLVEGDYKRNRRKV